MSMAAESGHKRGVLQKAMLREAFGDEIPLEEAEKIVEAVSRFTESSGAQPGRRRRRYNARCGFVAEDGTRCKQRGWLGGEFCFQHDPETAELRKLAGRRSQERLTKEQEVEELLDEAMEELRAGRMKPGQAYAVGYLAQLMLTARVTRLRETKLDVKWFWEMTDLAIAFDDAQKSLKEKARKAREEKKAKKARKARGSEDEKGTEEAGEEDEAEERGENEEETEPEDNGQEAGQSGSVADFQEE
ncbi:MAG: hypothetical protein L0170_09215 [Acidobacteria bacterium]|nr:hypothetical protein [Acidobacteriota bacterium]